MFSEGESRFYAAYDPTEGITTASVLGGFFVLVCLLGKFNAIRNDNLLF